MNKNIVPDISKIKTFYINLKKDTEKNKTFVKNDFINYKRFPAIYAKKYKDDDSFLKKISLLTQSKIHLNKRNTHEDINSFGAIGCSLSHYYIWKSFLEEKLDEEYLNFFNQDDENDISDLEHISFAKNGNEIEDEYLLIFEDDLNIVCDKLKNQIENDIQEIMKYKVDWDIFILKNLLNRDSENLIVKEEFSPVNGSSIINDFMTKKCTDKYCKINAYFGTQCYIIKKSAIKKIIESNYFFPIECHIDAFLSLLSQKNIIKIISRSTDNKYISLSSLDSNINHNQPIIEYNMIYFIIIIFILVCIIIFYITKN
jgi:GR25 family glycosyltransferase involved in LPS biosynthesis